jgi:hypothetical protein
LVLRAWPLLPHAGGAGAESAIDAEDALFEKGDDGKYASGGKPWWWPTGGGTTSGAPLAGDWEHEEYVSFNLSSFATLFWTSQTWLLPPGRRHPSHKAHVLLDKGGFEDPQLLMLHYTRRRGRWRWHFAHVSLDPLELLGGRIAPKIRMHVPRRVGPLAWPREPVNVQVALQWGQKRERLETNMEEQGGTNVSGVSPCPKYQQ